MDLSVERGNERPLFCCLLQLQNIVLLIGKHTFYYSPSVIEIWHPINSENQTEPPLICKFTFAVNIVIRTATE